MKTILFSLALLAAPMAQSQSDGEQKAKYEVPAPAELEEYAKFKVDIKQPYAGPETEVISYTFPEELTGQPALTVTLKRVPGTTNSWESREMNAECAEEAGDEFVCEMFLNKKPATTTNKMVDLGSVFSGNMVMKDSASTELETFINKQNVINFLTANIASPQALQGHKDILDIFLSNEPAGILSYKFSAYKK